MLVRIQFQPRPRPPKRSSGDLRIAAGLAVLLSPLALMAAILGMWRIGADLGIAGEFAITEGAFSHWQVWLALAAILQTMAVILGKYHSGEVETE